MVVEIIFEKSCSSYLISPLPAPSKFLDPVATFEELFEFRFGRRLYSVETLLAG